MGVWGSDVDGKTTVEADEGGMLDAMTSVAGIAAALAFGERGSGGGKSMTCTGIPGLPLGTEAGECQLDADMGTCCSLEAGTVALVPAPVIADGARVPILLVPSLWLGKPPGRGIASTSSRDVSPRSSRSAESY